MDGTLLLVDTEEDRALPAEHFQRKRRRSGAVRKVFVEATAAPAHFGALTGNDVLQTPDDRVVHSIV